VTEYPPLRYLGELEKKVRWLATWMIHCANLAQPDGIKVGGHQASSASLSTIMTALYFHTLRPEDRVAVKPHASPVFHAIQYLLGRQSRDKLTAFRGYGGAQSYPSRTKDSDDVDFSTGSVGLGVAQTLFSSLVQDYIHAHGWRPPSPEGRMIALVGDAELDEGNIFEAMLEGWKQGLRNCWWIIDYNRQSLDAVIREGLWTRYEALFCDLGWEVVILKHGSLQQEAFRQPGGDQLCRWIERCPNQIFSALVFQGGEAWRQRLLRDLGDGGQVTRLINSYSDDDLARLMTNLGGHDLATLVNAFETAKSGQPVCFLAYTIKGFGLPLAGHKDNHAALMTSAQMQQLQDSLGIRAGHEWDKFEGSQILASQLRDFVANVPFARDVPRRHVADRITIPPRLEVQIRPVMSTQAGFGGLLNDIGRTTSELAARIVTASPDVTVSTNLGPWVNRRKVYASQTADDEFKELGIASPFDWQLSPQGQHIELGIAEMNLFLLLSALGLSHSIHGERLLPIGTLYDTFIARGLDALNYACYQDARFILVATPSGISLSHEGGAHQSITTPLIGIAQDRLAAFEPAFVDELAIVLRWAFEHIQRNEGDEPDRGNGLTDSAGGSVYLRLSTRPIEQPQRELSDELARQIIDGGYWMRPPGPNNQVVIAFMGAVAPEAIQAVGLMAEDRPDVGLLAVTSADRLYAGWTAAQRSRERGLSQARSHIERLLLDVPPGSGLVTVLDGHPATLAWLGAVCGHRVRTLGVEQFGQTGSIAELYEHYNIDAQAIIAAAEVIAPGRPIRYLHAVR